MCSAEFGRFWPGMAQMCFAFSKGTFFPWGHQLKTFRDQSAMLGEHLRPKVQVRIRVQLNLPMIILILLNGSQKIREINGAKHQCSESLILFSQVGQLPNPEAPETRAIFSQIFGVNLAALRRHYRSQVRLRRPSRWLGTNSETIFLSLGGFLAPLTKTSFTTPNYYSKFEI